MLKNLMLIKVDEKSSFPFSIFLLQAPNTGPWKNPLVLDARKTKDQGIPRGAQLMQCLRLPPMKDKQIKQHVEALARDGDTAF